MKKTETYQLALIETSDTFSPEVLNENAQKVEAAIAAESAARRSADTAEAQARASADAALDQRLKVFEARHMAFGNYSTTSSTLNINLGFRPKAVLAFNEYGIGGLRISGGPSNYQLTLTDTGFSVAATETSGTNFNRPGTYSYIALG